MARDMASARKRPAPSSAAGPSGASRVTFELEEEEDDDVEREEEDVAAAAPDAGERGRFMEDWPEDIAHDVFSKRVGLDDFQSLLAWVDKLDSGAISREES